MAFLDPASPLSDVSLTCAVRYLSCPANSSADGPVWAGRSFLATAPVSTPRTLFAKTVSLYDLPKSRSWSPLSDLTRSKFFIAFLAMTRRPERFSKLK